MSPSDPRFSDMRSSNSFGRPRSDIAEAGIRQPGTMSNFKVHGKCGGG
jgi:hypothetical protein